MLRLQRLHLADSGLVVRQLGVGSYLAKARVFEGPLRRNIVKIGVSADRRHAEASGNLQDGFQRFCRVAASSRGVYETVADLYDSAVGLSLEANAANSQTVGLTSDLVVAERTLLSVLLGSAQKAADASQVPFEWVVGCPSVA